MADVVNDIAIGSYNVYKQTSTLFLVQIYSDANYVFQLHIEANDSYVTLKKTCIIFSPILQDDNSY